MLPKEGERAIPRIIGSFLVVHIRSFVIEEGVIDSWINMHLSRFAERAKSLFKRSYGIGRSEVVSFGVEAEHRRV